MRITLRTLRAVALAIPLTFVGVSSAAAQSRDSSSQAQGQKRIAVGAFEGTKNAQVRSWVVNLLKDDGYDVVDADIGPDEGSSSYREAASELGVDAIVTGKVSKNFNLTITVRNAADGSNLGDLDFKGGSQPKLQKALQNQLGSAIADPLSMAEGARKAESSDDEDEDEAAESEEESSDEEAASDSASDAASPLELEASIRAFNRQFDYTDPRSNLSQYPLAPHEQPLAPALVLDARLYPLAFSSSEGLGAHLGIQLHFEKSFFAKTVVNENTDSEEFLDNDMQEFRVGLRGRIPFGASELGIFVDYGNHKYTFSGDEKNPIVPDVSYGFVRPGVDARFRLGEILLGLHLAPRFLLSMGELDLEGVWFPGAKGSGLEYGGEFGYAVSSGLDILVGFDVVQYGFDFNAIPNDNPVVAGGATDRYISGRFGILYRLGK